MTAVTIEKLVYQLEASVENAVSGFSKTERSLKGVDSAAEGTTTKLGGMSGAAASLTSFLNPTTIAVGVLTAGLYELTESVVSAIGVFEEYQQAVVNSASVTGAVGEKYTKTLENIDDVAQTIGKSTIFTATETANAIYDIASSGEDVANLTAEQLQPIMDLAAGTQYDLTESTELLTGTVATFGMTMDDTQRIADVYTKTVGSSKATMDKLALSHQYVAGTADTLGISLEELNSMLAVMYNRNVKGAKAGRTLNMAMVQLLNPSKEMKEVYSELGLSLEEMNPMTQDFVDILDRLHESGMDARQASVLFGTEAVSPMLKLVENIQQVRQYQEELKNATGYSAQLAAQQKDTEKNTKEIMKSAIEASQINLGEKMEGSMRSIYESITNTTPYIDKFVDKFFEIGGKAKAELQPAIDTLKRIETAVIGITKDALEPLEESLSGEDLSGYKMATEDIVRYASKLLSIIASILEFIDANPILVRWPADIVRGLLELVSASYKAFVKVRTYIIEQVGDAFNFIIEKYNDLVPFMQSLGMEVGYISTDMFDPLKESAKTAHEEVTDELDGIESDYQETADEISGSDLTSSSGTSITSTESSEIPSYAGKQASYGQVLGVDTAKAVGLSGVYNQEVAKQRGFVSSRIIPAANTKTLQASIPAASTSVMQQARAPTTTAAVSSQKAGAGITKQDLIDAFNGLKEQFVEALKQEPRDVNMTLNANITNQTSARNLQKQIGEAAARGVSGKYSF